MAVAWGSWTPSIKKGAIKFFFKLECSGFVFCFWIFWWCLGCFLVTVLTFGVSKLLSAVEFSFFSSITKTWTSVKSIITELLANFWRPTTWNSFRLLSQLLKIFPQFPNRHLHWLNTWFWPWVWFSLVWTRCFVECLFYLFFFLGVIAITFWSYHLLFQSSDNAFYVVVMVEWVLSVCCYVYKVEDLDFFLGIVFGWWFFVAWD